MNERTELLEEIAMLAKNFVGSFDKGDFIDLPNFSVEEEQVYKKLYDKLEELVESEDNDTKIKPKMNNPYLVG